MCVVGYHFLDVENIGVYNAGNSCSNLTFDGFLTVMSGGIVMDLDNLLELSVDKQLFLVT